MASSLHRPKASYKGSNGFIESSLSNGVSNGQQPSTSSQIEAIENHRFAQYVLEHRGYDFPSSLTEMKELTMPPTIPSLKARISRLKEQHEKEVEDLLEYQAREYLVDALDSYMERDECFDMDPNERDILERDPKIYFMNRMSPPLSSTQSAHLSLLRYTHLSTLLPLQSELHNLTAAERSAQVLRAAQEVEERRIRDAQFPMSVDEYRAMRSKEVQLRVARFLVLCNAEHNVRMMGQEKMMGEFGWAWRQVSPLCDEYQNNPEFKAEIRDKLKEVEVRDPRRKSSSMM
ncbi:hypothetical protein JAAARDRAFT_142389 [Jaapia argillacea MUCL 33604]|uniref:Uncharacterized protein n=1 Tax=Jaapia argillacea MUCL 33604 TaxID=933084 RepID=A0A067P5G0_9AGAM|nr:hypothetical protein JAAARDRAFT_142389 [Jaapia argillacea MUCL 33604]